MLSGISSWPAVLRVPSGVYTGGKKKISKAKGMDLWWGVSHLRLILLVLYPCFLWCLFLTSCRQSLYDSSGNNSRIWLSSTYLLSEKRITSLFAEYHKSNEPKLHHNMLLRLILKRVSFKRFICPRVQAPPCLTKFSVEQRSYMPGPSLQLR